MTPHPHDVDVNALLCIAVLYNLPIACNRSTADFLISSSLMEQKYPPVLNDYTTYLERSLSTKQWGAKVTGVDLSIPHAGLVKHSFPYRQPIGSERRKDRIRTRLATALQRSNSIHELPVESE
jgi:hypothetical protein